MTQTHTIGTHRTKVTNDDETIKVRYCDTDVMTFDRSAGDITLDTGGWFTSTTKVRMNQASNTFDLGFRVYQKNKIWFVRKSNGEVIEFDGDKVTFKGHPVPGINKLLSKFVRI
tara:strand:+ start:173 stop:514 length:342 start_codon:yes stop_codon:yes gene_type:complete